MNSYEWLSVSLAGAALLVGGADVLATIFQGEIHGGMHNLRGRALWFLLVERRRFRASCTVALCGMLWFLIVWIHSYIPLTNIGIHAQTRRENASSNGRSVANTLTIHGVRFVRIPAGDAGLGCVLDDDECTRTELPLHGVHIAKSFWMASTETTNGAYQSCVNAHACVALGEALVSQDNGVSRLPVTWIDAGQAREFCRWLGGDLPTESEWEYAARGGLQNSRYPWGDRISSTNARFRTARPEGAAPVGSFPPNGYGLHDMSGNVAEWCVGPMASDGKPFIIVKGGSYKTASDRLRVSARSISDIDSVSEAIGFRCVVNKRD